MNIANHQPFFSICIPAYKHIDFLNRLLDSIAIQEYKNFEVVLTDDSPDASVQNLLSKYTGSFEINYIKNPVALGTPANWNQAISHAKGKWIKLMHDDDWFYDKYSLGIFAKFAEVTKDDFLFCSYNNVYINNNFIETIRPNRLFLYLMKRFSSILFSQNIIGPPSVILHRNDKKMLYDVKVKWVVDIDFYIARLKFDSFKYINKPLINVGISSDQVTFSCINNTSILLFENFYLLKKSGWDLLNYIWVYDFFWRLFRNLELQNDINFSSYGIDFEVPHCFYKIIKFQNKIPRRLLKIGIFSKIIMSFHFLTTLKPKS